MKIKIMILGLISLFLFNRNLPFLYSQIEGTYHETLIGLDLTEVRITCLAKSYSDEYALTDEMLSAFLETELRKRGFKKIITDNYSTKNLKKNQLSVYPRFKVVIVIHDEEVRLSFEVLDEVFSTRNPKRKFEAILWVTQTIMPIVRGTRQMLDWVIIILNQFILDYEKSNPKK